jgi:hypothetical protein
MAHEPRPDFLKFRGDSDERFRHLSETVPGRGMGGGPLPAGGIEATQRAATRCTAQVSLATVIRNRLRLRPGYHPSKNVNCMTNAMSAQKADSTLFRLTDDREDAE